jgi:hypothetical protein
MVMSGITADEVGAMFVATVNYT